MICNNNNKKNKDVERARRETKISPINNLRIIT